MAVSYTRFSSSLSPGAPPQPSGVRLSQIQPAASPPLLIDRLVGVTAGDLDQLYTLQQVQIAIGGGQSTPFANPVTLDGVANHFATYNIFGGTQGPYWINLNLYNVGALTGFTFGAIAYPNTFPNYTTFSWSWPFPGSPLWGYPEIVYGTQAGGGFGGGPANKPTPKPINNLGTLALTYNLTLTTQSGDDTSYLIETWAQTTPGNQSTVTHEILFYAYATPAVSSFILSFPTHFNYSVNGFNVYFALIGTGVFMMPVTTPGGTTPLNMAQPGTTYTIDFAALITAALDAGWLAGSDLIGGYEVGFETRENTGSAVFSRLEWQWSPPAPPPPTNITTILAPIFSDGAIPGGTATVFGNPGLYVSSTNTDWIAWDGWQSVSGTPQRVVEVTTRNWTTGGRTPNVIAGTRTLTADAHGSPSMTRDPVSGCVYIFYGAHNSALRVAQTTVGDNPSAWTDTVTLDTATYGNFTWAWGFVNGRTLHLLYMTNGASGALQDAFAVTTAAIASNGTLTWSGTTRRLIDGGGTNWFYPGNYVQHGTQVFWGFNTAGSFASFPVSNIYVVGYDMATGNVINVGASTVIAPGSQPVNLASLNANFRIVVSADVLNPTIAINADGTHVVYADSTNTSSAALAQYLFHNGTSWAAPFTVYNFGFNDAENTNIIDIVNNPNGGVDVYYNDQPFPGAGNNWKTTRLSGGTWTPPLIAINGSYAIAFLTPLANTVHGESMGQQGDSTTTNGNVKGYVITSLGPLSP